MNTCIVFSDNGEIHREYFDAVLGKWLPDDSWWHPVMEVSQ